MKVLMLAPGHSIHSKRQLHWLLDRGCHVTLGATNDPIRSPRAGYRFVYYPMARGARRVPSELGRKMATWVVAALSAMQLRALRRQIRPDVTHVHEVDERVLHCVLAGLKPLIVSAWGTDINQHFSPRADPHKRARIGRGLAHADLLLVDAPDIAEKCMILADRAIRTEILPLGIDTTAFTPNYESSRAAWKRDLAVPEDATVLLSMRGWDRKYGHHLILEAFARARVGLGDNTFLIFKVFHPTGLNSTDARAYEHDIRRQAESLGIDMWVRWIRDVDFSRVPELYALADVIINYPTMDAFPVTFMEAAACGRPVITCRLPSYEGTFAEKYFRMVEPGNVLQLAEAMIEIVQRPPADMRRLLCEARKTVEQEYDEEIIADKLLRFYRELTGHKPVNILH